MKEWVILSLSAGISGFIGGLIGMAIMLEKELNPFALLAGLWLMTGFVIVSVALTAFVLGLLP